MADYPVEGRGPDGEALTIDAASIGSRTPERAVVISSGLHGIEGFVGSAVQLAWLWGLGSAAGCVDGRTRVVFLHALNPHGFAWRRRANERNVDLNRNFLDTGEAYAGFPPGYDLVHELLNPLRPPGALEVFSLRAAWAICRHGRGTLATAVAAGQYEHADGLFFGGREAEESTRLVQKHYGAWIGGATAVIHLDLHSGLGRWGRGQLIVEPDQAVHLDRYRASFEPLRVVLAGDDAAYAARGTLGAWLARSIDMSHRCRVAVAEFGTYSQLRVLAALRAEQIVRRLGDPASPRGTAATRELMECFCPASPGWREAVVRLGVRLVDQALAAV